MRHLEIAREEPTNERNKPQRRFGPPVPPDPRGHGASLRASLRAALREDRSEGGFDPRRLLKLQVVPGFQADALAAIPGIEVVSQEADNLVLAFANAEGLAEFEARLATLARDGNVSRKDIFFALRGFDGWTPEDRTGAALEKTPPAVDEPAVLDVELWPLDRPADRTQMRVEFERWLTEQAVARLDHVDKRGLVLYRLRVPAGGLPALLRYRDVRTVDLPPRLGLDTELLYKDINAIGPPQPPPNGAPVLGILDTGIAAAHPLLGPAVGEAAGFLPPGREGTDENGHGTHVAGIGLYGDVAACLGRGEFVPELRIVSGRVFANDGMDATRFVENAVEEAVRYFLEAYGCRVFCLAYGDRNKVYDGRHVRGMAYLLDLLSRELGVVFVVPTGNLLPGDLPDDPRQDYPGYLFEEGARLLDPATALNAITVGGLAGFEADSNAQRNPETIESLPIARTDQPSPFTRSGFSVRGAIKPDLVAHAGNWSVRRVGNSMATHRLGVLSLGKEFATGRPFVEDTGTSYAAPAVANVAAKALHGVPGASTNLVRALLAAHARWPIEPAELFPGEEKALAREKVLRLVGYGSVEGPDILESSEHAVTLFAEDEIANDRHHFYELPLPPDLWDAGQRRREVTAALAYSPEVRTTRIDYRASELLFQIVSKPSLDAVVSWFQRNRPENAEQVGEYASGRTIPNTERKRGTLQRSTWVFQNTRSADSFRLFLVVTRHDKPWSPVRDVPERYALAIAIKDRENGEAHLYTQIQAQLRQRAQVRARQRARVGGAG